MPNATDANRNGPFIDSSPRLKSSSSSRWESVVVSCYIFFATSTTYASAVALVAAFARALDTRKRGRSAIVGSDLLDGSVEADLETS
jgi:hypothetical protein